MTFLTFCAALGFLGLFLIGIAALITALRHPPRPLNHDLFNK